MTSGQQQLVVKLITATLDMRTWRDFHDAVAALQTSMVRNS